MDLQKFARVAVVATAAAVVMAANARAADISGAGATFPYPIYAKWADAYKKETGNGLNYQSIGSGGGIKQIEANTVTSARPTSRLTVDVLDKNGLVQWPHGHGRASCRSSISTGIKPGELVLDGPTLADIYLGKITKWNDPAIKKLNPDVNLPSSAISVVQRSDGSGTTFNFTNYLSKVSPDWKSQGRRGYLGRMADRHRRQGQ